MGDMVMYNEIENFVKFTIFIERIALILVLVFGLLALYNLYINFDYIEARLAFRAAGWSAVVFCLSWLFVEIFR